MDRNTESSKQFGSPVDASYNMRYPSFPFNYYQTPAPSIYHMRPLQMQPPQMQPPQMQQMPSSALQQPCDRIYQQSAVPMWIPNVGAIPPVESRHMWFCQTPQIIGDAPTGNEIASKFCQISTCTCIVSACSDGC